MSIVVNVDWLENHKPGRNAYYQVFELKPEGGTPITVCHWGKITPSVERWHRPVLGGETQIFRGALRASKTSAKKKRGYEAIDAITRHVSVDSSWLVETFGATLAHELEMAMFLEERTAVHDAMQPRSKPDNEVLGGTAKAEPEAHPADWGSW